MKTNIPSKRETEVLELIAFGYNEKQISNRLFISEATVQSHKRNLFSKLDASNSPSLIFLAIKYGYLNIDIKLQNAC